MAKYEKKDCRNSAALGKTVSDYPKFYKHWTAGLMIAPAGSNRHEKRASAHFSGRKNSRGFELGFNAKTWADYCVGEAKLRKERAKKLAKKGA